MHNCRVYKWAEGHRQEHDETLKDKWNPQHSWVGRKVEKLFGDVMYTGTVDQWLPDSKTEWELWRIKYDDGDMEELDILELMQVIKEKTIKKQTNSQKTTQPLQPQVKRDLTRKDKRREKKRRRQHANDTNDHDTLPNGQIAGRIHASNTTLSTFIATLKATTIGVQVDGHCLRRALGKLWNMQPGEVIHKMREGARHLQQNSGKLYIESDGEWYNITKNRPAHWDNIQTNTKHPCSRGEWGGDNELSLWAYITQTRIIVTNKTTHTFTKYHPNRYTLPTIHEVATLRRMHDTLTAQDKQPIYLTHNGYHYNPIKYERATPIHTNFNMPTMGSKPTHNTETKKKTQSGITG